MSVRRRTTPARIGAGVMLAAACVMGPVAANAAPVGGFAPLQGGICSTPSLALSSTQVQAGESVTVTGNCFGENATVELRISGATQQTFTLTANSDGTVTHTFTLDAPGRYTIDLVSKSDQGIRDDSAVIVEGSTEGEPGEGEPDGDRPGGDNPGGENPEGNPDDGTGTPDDGSDDGEGEGNPDEGEGTPEEGEGTDPDPEEPTDPVDPDPTDPVDPDPTDPVDPDPTDPVDPDPTDPGTPGDGTDGGGDTDDNNGGSDSGSTPSPSDPAPETPSPGESTSPIKDFPGSNSPAPSAGGQQQRPPSAAAELPAAPETGTRDFSGSNSQPTTAQQRMGSLTLSIGQAFAGMFGSSTEAPGTDGSDPAASDGGGELAETGTEVTAAAAFAALALMAGAGMLWLQRRRHEG